MLVLTIKKIYSRDDPKFQEDINRLKTKVGYIGYNSFYEDEGFEEICIYFDAEQLPNATFDNVSYSLGHFLEDSNLYLEKLSVQNLKNLAPL